MTGHSDGGRELLEGCAEPVAGGDVDGEFVVTAVQVLDEGVSGSQDPDGSAAFQPAQRPQTRFQPAGIGCDGVIRILLCDVQC